MAGSISTILTPVAGGRGLVAAVPFLRPVDIVGEPAEPLTSIYGEVIAAARARRRPDQALIVTGHLYVAGADTQYLSERRVAIGGQEAAPLRLFPDDIDYVALGHIHRAQRVGRASIRYAGAPLPLSLDEADYKNQIVAIEFAGGRMRDCVARGAARDRHRARARRGGAAGRGAAELGRLPLLVPAIRRGRLEVSSRSTGPSPSCARRSRRRSTASGPG
jgi:exonuclease SbcD